MRSGVAILSILTLSGSLTSRADSPRSWDALFPNAQRVPTIVAPGEISTGDDESHPSVYPDGHTLYFLKNTPSFDFWTIVASERKDGHWSRPQTVSFSGQYSDADIVFTPDGRRAYFISTRPVDGKPRTDTEIWTVERDASGRWGEPRHVDELSSPTSEWFPTLTADGTIYFGSSREGGMGGCDIWRARIVDGKFQAPENLGAPVNTPAEEVEPFITADGQLLIIAALRRSDSLGSYDIYVSRREGDRWQAPRHPGAPINSAGWDMSPRLSPDGKLFLFTSNRGFGSEPQPLATRLTFDQLERRIRMPNNGLRDIYVVRAEALFK